MKKDNVEHIVAQWQVEMPNLETDAMAVLGRLKRIMIYSEKAMNQHFATYGINQGEFDVLATLRRSGHPYALKPTELYQSLMITSGAMTNRINTLEKKGLVKRQFDKEDKRAVDVKLTNQGETLVNRAVKTHVALEQELLKHLSFEDVNQLNRLLKKWENSLEV